MCANCNCSGCKGIGCTTHWIVKILVIVGGINWGLVGVSMLMGSDANLNVVNLLLGSWPIAEAIVYVLVGVAAVMKIFGCRCKKCVAACASCESCGPDNTENKVPGNM